MAIVTDFNIKQGTTAQRQANESALANSNTVVLVPLQDHFYGRNTSKFTHTAGDAKFAVYDTNDTVKVINTLTGTLGSGNQPVCVENGVLKVCAGRLPKYQNATGNNYGPIYLAPYWGFSGDAGTAQAYSGPIVTTPNFKINPAKGSIEVPDQANDGETIQLGFELVESW